MDSLRDACAVGDIRFFGGRALVREQATEGQAVHQGKCLRVQVTHELTISLCYINGLHFSHLVVHHHQFNDVLH
jgi:hypothetical protein